MPTTRREWEPKLKLQCSLCGGSACKRCGTRAAALQSLNAVPGLHSDYVHERIVAMQRPSGRLMEEFDIVNVMKR